MANKIVIIIAITINLIGKVRISIVYNNLRSNLNFKIFYSKKKDLYIIINFAKYKLFFNKKFFKNI